MKYVSGIDALNYHAPNDVSSGDWHSACCSERDMCIRDTRQSVFTDELLRDESHMLRVSGEQLRIATHVRAVLDMLEAGAHISMQGFSDDWLGDDSLNELVMTRALELRDSDVWRDVDKLLSREFGAVWIMKRADAR